MNFEQRLLLKKNLDILLRRKKTLFLCFLLGMAGGILFYLQQPKIYESTALIRYQRQNINPSAMSPDDTRTRTRDIINTVAVQVTRRSSLEEIIKEFDLYPALQATVPMEKLVEMMRETHITTQFLEGGDVFTVSYKGNNQQKVTDVTNTIAQKFIDENLHFRKSLATRTSSYIEDELEIAKKSLNEKEAIMRDYKLRYHNEMPDQLLNNTSRLNALQEQYQNIHNSRLALEQTRLQIQDQIAARTAVLYQQSLNAAASPGSRSRESNLATVEQVRLRLRNLQPRYTDKHPEVKRLKKLLQNLETAQSDAAATGQDNNGLEDRQINEFKQQLEDINFSIQRLNDERQAISNKIEQYEKWIAAAPVREAEWASLTRDYEQIREYTQRLVTQSLQADSAMSLENQLQGSQFEIIDAAHYPVKPLEPDFFKIMLMSIALGLSAGAVLTYGLESLGTSFKDPADLEKYIDIPVSCALPIMLTKKEKREQKVINAARMISLLLFGAALLGGIFYFQQQGMIIL